MAHYIRNFLGVAPKPQYEEADVEELQDVIQQQQAPPPSALIVESSLRRSHHTGDYDYSSLPADENIVVQGPRGRPSFIFKTGNTQNETLHNRMIAYMRMIRARSIRVAQNSIRHRLRRYASTLQRRIQANYALLNESAMLQFVAEQVQDAEATEHIRNDLVENISPNPLYRGLANTAYNQAFSREAGPSNNTVVEIENVMLEVQQTESRKRKREEKTE